MACHDHTYACSRQNRMNDFKRIFVFLFATKKGSLSTPLKEELKGKHPEASVTFSQWQPNFLLLNDFFKA
jgi:hypothetical protein